jgi:hypothetical protein
LEEEMETIQITVAVPAGARWQTTDEAGAVEFWRGDKPSPVKEPYHRHGEWWFRGEGRLLAQYPTNIPCPNWRDTLIDLEAHP